jgi:hypothetical protein
VGIFLFFGGRGDWLFGFFCFFFFLLMYWGSQGNELPLEPHLQPFSALVIFQIGSWVFVQAWPQTMILLPMASYVAGIIGTHHHHHAWLLSLDKVLTTFCLGWPQTSQVPPDFHLLSSSAQPCFLKQEIGVLDLFTDKSLWAQQERQPG